MSSSSEYYSSPEGTSPVKVTAEGPFFYTQPSPPSSVSPTVDSAHPTPLISNTAIHLLQLGPNTFATSPIEARVLDYKETPIESPVVCASCVPRGYRIMSDADDADHETMYDDRSDILSDNGTEEAVELVAVSDLVDAASILLTDIARSMVNEPLDSTMSEAEVALVINSSVNTKEYERNKKGIKARFFDTIEKYGSNLLK
jgi:hypothetical protein